MERLSLTCSAHKLGPLRHHLLANHTILRIPTGVLIFLPILDHLPVLVDQIFKRKPTSESLLGKADGTKQMPCPYSTTLQYKFVGQLCYGLHGPDLTDIQR